MVNDQLPPDDGATEVDQVVAVVGRLGGKVISLLGWIVGLTFFVFAVFTGAYFYALFALADTTRRNDALENIERTMMTVWDKIIPIGSTALRVIAPVIVILLAVALLTILSRRGAAPFDLSRIVSDLPSVLAMVIVITICLLPLSGLPVPDVLNNVALVVVGFYFGKRTSKAGAAEGAGDAA